jgi:hypothetical protein
VGSEEIWARSEEALKEALAAKGWDYAVDAGGGAFYGPKIDIKVQDAIGRKWQCSTIQLDFNLPDRCAAAGGNWPAVAPTCTPTCTLDGQALLLRRLHYSRATGGAALRQATSVLPPTSPRAA